MRARACLIAGLGGVQRVEKVFRCLASGQSWEDLLKDAECTYPLFIFRAFHCGVFRPIGMKILFRLLIWQG